MAATSDAAIKLEIARLTGAINRHRSGDAPQAQPRFSAPRQPYAGPSYKQRQSTYIRPGSSVASSSTTIKGTSAVRATPTPSQTRDVTINGVTFETSRRSLVRKDLSKPSPVSVVKPVSAGPPRPNPEFRRTKAGQLIKANRILKPKGPSRHRNMTLDNNRRPFQSRRVSNKKSVDKPCPRFTTTGACNRGLTCPYQHDASKIAICWPFLQGTCPQTADTCALSHDPTPNRTPLCVHFANNGRCTRAKCPYPHVRVGARTGVCRDFAVLGYCERGLDCEQQHVRECPDFAENGKCANKKCKLPHVIRANRNRAAAVKTLVDKPASSDISGDTDTLQPVQEAVPLVTADDAQLGDEFISLTFNESESESEGSDDEDGDEEDQGEDEEEVDSPTTSDKEILY